MIKHLQCCESNEQSRTWMATNEGGATPMKVPIQNGARRTSMTGETMLMNQLGRKGVILQEENKKNSLAKLVGQNVIDIVTQWTSAL
jgi:hypothetical protein